MEDVKPNCQVLARGDKIFLLVDGEFPTKVAVPAAEQFERLAVQMKTPFEFVTLVWNMSVIDKEGREAWQKALAANKHKIRAVRAHVGSPLVRMAASAVCLYAGIKISFIDETEARKVQQAYGTSGKLRAS